MGTVPLDAPPSKRGDKDAAFIDLAADNPAAVTSEATMEGDVARTITVSKKA